ncbi:hypothetical protein Prudu_010971 [Prunus dulcis]|uniref:Trafficking protein particle complex subunit 13 n=1 Tax=Prunus dulcis TaxID=3755 RepID=A0A4Y1RA91_PRUDU|nr:hypothetical protein Prudu_010971 [Prunus dulcis]
MSSGQGGPHSLAFRVMRLCKPHSRLTPFPSSSTRPISSSARTSSTTQLPPPNFLASSTTPKCPPPTPPISATAPDSSFTTPPTLSASLASSSSSSVRAEMQTERQRLLLLDTSKSPVESIRAGGRYDFIVEHDVKELGAHTLVCTALYYDGDGERKYLPQFFKFIVANPLSVRTKVRVVKEITFLEACIENHTKSNLFMDQVEFEPAQHWSAKILKADEHHSDKNSQTRETFKPPILIKSGGGIHNYLYQLKSHGSAQTKVEGSNILGKLQITWRTNLGEPGRLQTQQIMGTPIIRKDIELHVVEVPSAIKLERPFSLHLKLANETDKELGPFEVWLSQDDSREEKKVVINGLQTVVLPRVEAFDSTDFHLVRRIITPAHYGFSLNIVVEVIITMEMMIDNDNFNIEMSVHNLIATQLGVQRITGITIFNTREKQTYEPLPDLERPWPVSSMGFNRVKQIRKASR